MKKILLGCLIASAAFAGVISSAQAADPYWRSHHDVEWQDRATFKDPASAKTDWLRDHCIRDWDGHEMCRR
jgi:hypothetical protein